MPDDNVKKYGLGTTTINVRGAAAYKRLEEAHPARAHPVGFSGDVLIGEILVVDFEVPDDSEFNTLWRGALTDSSGSSEPCEPCEPNTSNKNGRRTVYVMDHRQGEYLVYYLESERVEMLDLTRRNIKRWWIPRRRKVAQCRESYVGSWVLIKAKPGGLPSTLCFLVKKKKKVAGTKNSNIQQYMAYFETKGLSRTGRNSYATAEMVHVPAEALE